MDEKLQRVEVGCCYDCPFNYDTIECKANGMLINDTIDEQNAGFPEKCRMVETDGVLVVRVVRKDVQR